MLSLKPYRPKQQELVIFRTNVKEKFWNRGANALHNHAIGLLEEMELTQLNGVECLAICKSNAACRG